MSLRQYRSIIHNYTLYIIKILARRPDLAVDPPAIPPAARPHYGHTAMQLTFPQPAVPRPQQLAAPVPTQLAAYPALAESAGTCTGQPRPRGTAQAHRQ